MPRLLGATVVGHGVGELDQGRVRPYGDLEVFLLNRRVF